MGRLSALSAANLQAIVVALNQTTGTPPAPSLDGATIYANNCAGCHGPLATSAKKGMTLARFTAAVTTNSATRAGYRDRHSPVGAHRRVAGSNAHAGASVGQTA
jgi:mono/diheme cytochrome c family protein